MSPLEDAIARAIRAQGPLGVAAYMTLCLHHRAHGYYADRDPLGPGGDFVTSPEVSQIFGELIGLALAQAWLEAGRPPLVRLVEAGPGRGTLMGDALRAAACVPGFRSAIRVHLVETNARLAALQRERLADASPEWHADLAEVPADAPLLLVANEFLDALPIRQLARDGDAFRERHVALDGQGRLAWALEGRPIPCGTPDPGTSPGAAGIVEVSPARSTWVGAAASRLVAQGGMALLIDYGAAELEGDTLQAVRGHRRVDPLEAPGESDLSSHVDFGALARAATAVGARTFGPVPQGLWLRRLGAEARLERLSRAATPDGAAELEEGARRLVDPEAMGELFKVLALAAPGWPCPAGLGPAEAAA